MWLINFWRNGVDSDGQTVEGGGATKSVDGVVIGEVVDTRARVLMGHRELTAGTIVAPAVRDAHHAAHHLVRNFHRQHDRSDSRSHQRILTS